jgi:hypothetical protein
VLSAGGFYSLAVVGGLLRRYLEGERLDWDWWVGGLVERRKRVLRDFWLEGMGLGGGRLQDSGRWWWNISCRARGCG